MNCPLKVAMSKLSIVSNGTAGDYSLIQQMAPTFQVNNKRKMAKLLQSVAVNASGFAPFS